MSSIVTPQTDSQSVDVCVIVHCFSDSLLILYLIGYDKIVNCKIVLTVFVAGTLISRLMFLPLGSSVLLFRLPTDKYSTCFDGDAIVATRNWLFNNYFMEI